MLGRRYRGARVKAQVDTKRKRKRQRDRTKVSLTNLVSVPLFLDVSHLFHRGRRRPGDAPTSARDSYSRAHRTRGDALTWDRFRARAYRWLRARAFDGRLLSFSSSFLRERLLPLVLVCELRLKCYGICGAAPERARTLQDESSKSEQL